MTKLGIEDLELKGKRVLIRVDFNVPLDQERRITDDTRITAALPTIKYVIAQGGRAILVSHLGRPKGKKDPALSLAPVAERLSQLLHQKVEFIDDCIGPDVEKTINLMKDGDILLLENLRFYSGEKKGDADFARELALPADVYIDDAFGTAHRAHVSMVGVTNFIDQCAAGYLLQKEIKYLGKSLEYPDRPFIAILGGAKVSDKIQVIENFISRVDSIMIGGAMAYTFLQAMGIPVGASKVEEVIEDKKGHTKAAGTVVWNGPMGVFEMEPFAKGTMEVARALAQSDAVSIIGGGDSVAAVNQSGLADKITHISTGGGASLEMLSGKSLPGIDALSDQ